MSPQKRTAQPWLKACYQYAVENQDVRDLVEIGGKLVYRVICTQAPDCDRGAGWLYRIELWHVTRRAAVPLPGDWSRRRRRVEVIVFRGNGEVVSHEEDV